MRIGGGAGCGACHRLPEFDIAPNSDNNGVIQNASGTGTDLTNTRSPSLRDMFSPAGGLNSQLMHNGAFTTMDQVLTHYDSPPLNPNLDNRLRRPGNNQRVLNLTPGERAALIAFMQTLTGSNVYVDPKWSDPFIAAPPVVLDVVVGDGLPQRSMVTSITILFDSEVNASASSFTLTNMTSLTDVTTIEAASDVIDGKTQVTLSFGTGDSVVTRNTENSLADGAYMIEVLGDQVTSVDGNIPLGEDFLFGGTADGLFRLYGDVNGDAFTTNLEYFLFMLPAIGSATGAPTYLDELDANGDGFITNLEAFMEFLPRIGTSL